MVDSWHNRFLYDIAFSPDFGRQMRFIAGPRQSGKTTLAKHWLAKNNCSQFYYNWDSKEIRTRYRQENDFLKLDLITNKREKSGKIWLCFDEIHKYPKWKNMLKDFFDCYEDSIQFIVTGSAKLNMFKHSGDSLAGRYFLFNLNPLITSELNNTKLADILPDKNPLHYIQKILARDNNCNHTMEIIEDLLAYSAFPEPFFCNNDMFNKQWHSNYFERIVEEDLRDISQISYLDKVIELISILPDKISSPLSINNLCKTIELNFNTVKNYLRFLKLGYVIFDIKPYNKNNTRLVKKERKIYFFDWYNLKDETACFENFIAFELKARIDLWNLVCKDDYDLFFVRTRDGCETDFLITQNNQPYFLIEVKLNNNDISSHHYRHQAILNNIPLVQIVKKNNIVAAYKNNSFVISAANFLG